MAVRPPSPLGPTPPRASMTAVPAPGRAGRGDVCRWDAAAVMFFPRRARSNGPDRADGPDRGAGPGVEGTAVDRAVVERTAGATAVDAGGPGRG